MQNLAQWCCVNPGLPEPDECPLRREQPTARLSVGLMVFDWFSGDPKCFSGDDFVSMASGERKLLSELRPGDRVLVMNSQKQIEEDEVIMMLDSQPKRPGLCATFSNAA